MDQEIKNFKQLVEASDRILVISHISPDPDAICSILLCGTTLSLNFPDKQVAMSSEELSGGLDFLEGYKSIQIEPLEAAIQKFKPQLIIIVDAMNYKRCTRGNAGAAANLVKKLGSKVAIIDHHEPMEVADNEVYINQKSPASAQDVYEVLFDHLNLKRPPGSAETVMVGILSDSARFLYQNPRHRDTFKLVSDLIDEGTSIESLENRATRYSLDEIAVLGHLAGNVASVDGYSYSFISDGFAQQWVKNKKSADELKIGCEVFVSGFIRNIDDNYWGFIVYPDLNAGVGRYSVSFRAMGNTKDVASIARKLGGGGHKPSAGAKFGAASVDEAIKKVRQAI